MSRRSRRLLITIVALLALLIAGSSFVSVYADWLWYTEVKKQTIMTTVLRTRLMLFLLFGGIAAAIVAANLFAAFALRPAYRPMSLEQQNLERYRLAITPRFRLMAAATAGFVGVITGLAAQSHWRTWLLFSNSQPFGGEPDPVLGMDASFYVFEYPFWRYLVSVAFTTIVLSIIASAFVHYLYGGLRLQGGGGRLSSAVIAHLSVLLAVFVALKAAAYYLDRFGLLLGYSDVSKVYGASAVDVNWLLPAKNILLWIAALCALMFAVNVGLRKVLLPGMALVLLLVSAVVVGGLVPAVAEQFTIKPNANEKEKEYIGRNIAATLEAYGIADVKKSTYEARAAASSSEILDDKTTVPSLRLADPSVLSRTFRELQQVRNFYSFNEQLDVDRYVVDGVTQDYVVGVRELASAELTPDQSNWINKHTVFTHGHGFVAAPANQVDSGGRPIFVSGFLSDKRNEEDSDVVDKTVDAFSKAVPVTQPRVYYGEMIRDYSIVGGKAGQDDREFDRPGRGGEQEEVSNTYDGTGGIKVGTLSRQLLYAAYFREKNFLLSDALHENSKLLYVRDPRQRVERVAPFLTVDGDPYPAVVGGRVKWIVDGYTTSASFPYSQRQTLGDAVEDSRTGRGTSAQPRDELNYIRNSVKATVDAYDGTITLYQFDKKDPVLKAWNKAFGGKLIETEIPAELREHFRYPEDLFKLQRNVYSKYHVSNPQVYFKADSFWRVPKDPTKDVGDAPQPPYYVLATFPGQDEPRFQVTSALTFSQRENLAALMTASYDENGNPSQQVLELPGNIQILGPNQVQPKMQNSDKARNDITQLERGKVDVVYGNLLTLPVAGGLLNVEPLYLISQSNTQYPTLARVLVSFGDSVGYGNTLEEALGQLFEGGTGSPPVTDPDPDPGAPPSPAPTPPTVQDPSVAAAVADIQKAIADLRNAHRTGDFAAVGTAQAALDAATKRFEAAQKNAPTGAPTPPG